MKYYTNIEIEREFNKLTRIRKLEILWQALDYMQQYNGRSKMLCIALAMGYNNIEGESNTYFKKERQHDSN